MKEALDLIRQLDGAVQSGLSGNELNSLFDALVKAYTVLSEDERKRVRDAYINCSHWGTFEFWMENLSYILRFRENGGLDDLRRAIAHYSLSDGYPDARDAIVGMDDLLVAAERHGIDPRPVFSEIAAISNPDGQWSLQKYMEARGSRNAGEERETKSPLSPALVLCETPDYEPRVVRERPGLTQIRETIQGLEWNDLTFVVLRRDEENWIEFSGNIEDGFSAKFREGGREYVTSQAPASILDGISLLGLYLQGDDQWRTKYEWE